MSYFTTDVFETKREILTFADKVASGLPRPVYKFIHDMIYGFAKNQSCHLSDIARALDEKSKLINVIDRLSANLASLSEADLERIMDNFRSAIENYIPDEPLVNLDNSEIVKRYARKLEDLDMVLDASSVKSGDIQPGYHICEGSVVTKEESQPLSLYTKVSSTKSDGFKSMNDEMLKCIRSIKKFLKRRCTFVMDRGFDADVFYHYFLKENEGKDDFIVRLTGKRMLLFKGKSKKIEEVAAQRKGKIRMNMYFREGDKEAYVSHTRVKLPKYKDELTLVLVYGLSEEKAMMLLTNKKVKDKRDVHQVVRQYIKRWRIEEGFRFKKTEYGFEKMLLRKLHSMNVLNTLLMIHLGHIAVLADKVNKKLLVIKIVERSKSLRMDNSLWFYKIKSGIHEILKFSQKGSKEQMRIRSKGKYKQLQLSI